MLPSLSLHHNTTPLRSLLLTPWNLPTPFPLSQNFPCPSPSRRISSIRSRTGRDGDISPPQSGKTLSGQKLWRKELLEQQFEEDFDNVTDNGGNIDLNDDPEKFFVNDPSFLVEQDMIRSDEGLEMQKEKTQKLSQNQRMQNRKQSEGEGSLLGSLVEKLLVADFFFIIFILVWFVAGLAEKAAFDTSTLIDVWLPLWPLLFQPALGFFMAGALWTAASKFLFSK